jgi:hypothetical protein
MALKLGDISKIPSKQKVFFAVLICVLMGGILLSLLQAGGGARDVLLKSWTS